jgi:hypothetical protein
MSSGERSYRVCWRGSYDTCFHLRPMVSDLFAEGQSWRLKNIGMCVRGIIVVWYPTLPFPFPPLRGIGFLRTAGPERKNEACIETTRKGEKGSMRHDKFAERAAERLEAVATAIEDEDRGAGRATVSVGHRPCEGNGRA